MSTTPRHQQQPQSNSKEERLDYSFSEQNESQDLSEEGWRTLAKIVQDVGPSLVCDEELEDLAAAEVAVNVKDAERAAVADKLRDELRELTRQHTQAAIASQRPPSHPSPAEHENQIRSKEQQQYSTGKQVNDEEASVAKKEVEIGKWRTAKEEIGKVEVGLESWTNGKVIRLKLFSEAGFSLVGNSGARKVLIRNDAKEDVHSAVIDSSRSKAYTANLIWSLASD